MSNERIDLTQFEGIGEWEVLEYWDEDEARYEIRTGRDNHSKHEAEVISKLPNLISELKRCYEALDEHDKLVGLLIENHFVETSPYETVKHLIETHQDYRASE
tara:strand:- start:13331 stop:13639 length:309 start_codon:yes stop_codon:yes gene_type:complete